MISLVDMGFLQEAWNWICGTVEKIWSWLADAWNWVTNQVAEIWDTIENKSEPFRELFTLKLMAKWIRARFDSLYSRLSSSDRQEMQDLLDAVDAKN